MSIRLKLSLAFALLALAAFAPTIWLTYHAVRVAATNKVAEDLGQTLSEFERQVQTLRRDFSLRIDASLRRVDFVQPLTAASSDDDEFGLGSAGDHEGSLKNAHALLSSADLSLLKGRENATFLMVNTNGEVIYDDAAPKLVGQRVTHLRVLDEALAGRTASDLWSPDFVRKLSIPLLKENAVGEDDLILVTAEPLRLRTGQRLGAVLLGESIRHTLLPALAQISRGEVAIEAMDDRFAGQPEAVVDAQRYDAVLEASMKRRGLPVDSVELRDQIYLGAHRELSVDGQQVGHAILLRALEPEMRPVLASFWHALLPEAAAFIFFSFLIIQLLSRRLTDPLVKLEAAAREVQRGNLQVTVPSSSRDEVGRLALTFNEMVKGLKQRDEIKGLFKRYLNPQVVEELIRHPEKASPGGERRELTLLFSDLVGFTTSSERMSPEALVALLNRYFEEATRVLAERGATLDKFIGDAIMCFWNAPLLEERHATLACLTALDLLKVVERLRPEFEEKGFANFSCRIGLNTGACVVGNLGSTDAQYYTAIGDTVNLASRLEGACKFYGTRTLISESTFKAASSAIVARELDLVRVKGRGMATRIYELIGPAGTPLPPQVVAFSEGLARYRAREFEAALERFRSAGDDPPSRLYADRCAQRIAEPPGADWDGVHTLEAK